jgi:folate-binding protein YgfZ
MCIRDSVEIGGSEMTIAKVEVAGWGWLLVVPNDSAYDLNNQLFSSNIRLCNDAALQRLRIEQQIPWYGYDLDESNLPQEINRNDQAISFTKGCYLGQETVARIDALGHVNQILVGVTITTTNLPPIGATIQRDGKTIFRLTSVSAAGNHFIGLGYLRREFADPGTKLTFLDGELTVRTNPPKN